MIITDRNDEGLTFITVLGKWENKILQSPILLLSKKNSFRRDCIRESDHSTTLCREFYIRRKNLGKYNSSNSLFGQMSIQKFGFEIISGNVGMRSVTVSKMILKYLKFLSYVFLGEIRPTYKYANFFHRSIIIGSSLGKMLRWNKSGKLQNLEILKLLHSLTEANVWKNFRL